MALPTYYNTGTVTVSNGSTSVVGVGTSWLTAGLVQAGDRFWAAGQYVRIASVNSNTSITLASNWPGSSISGGAYEIHYVPDNVRMATTQTQMLEALANGNISSLKNLTTAADKGLYYTGAGAAALFDLTAFGRSLVDDASASAAQATLGLDTILDRQNLLINGDFAINQRQFAGGALSAGVFGYDRWKADTGGANYSVSGYTVSITSGTLAQVVEPTVIYGRASLASQQVTISAEAPSQDLAVSFGSQSGTITAGAGRRSTTLTLGAGDTGSLTFKVGRSGGGAVTFSRLKLEVGATATIWNPRTVFQELLLAQRYYYRRRSRGTFDIISMFSAWSTTRCWGKLHEFSVPMRVAPTVALSNISHFSGYTSAAKTLTSVSSLTGTFDSIIVANYFETSSTWSVGDAVMIYMNNTSGYFEADAEL